MRRISTCVVGLMVFACALFAWQESADKPAVVNGASAQVQNFPGLPDCAKGAVVHGNPGEGASVILAKFTSGCTVPMHWHTPNEQLMFVSGKGTVNTKGEATQTMTANSYAFMPSKHPHKFTCESTCMFYLSSDGTFDIHYVDDSGNEIPTDQALKSAGNKPGKK
jgi:quercetin dioxygenase-like cupin family protein